MNDLNTVLVGSLTVQIKRLTSSNFFGALCLLQETGYPDHYVSFVYSIFNAAVLNKIRFYDPTGLKLVFVNTSGLHGMSSSF